MNCIDFLPFGSYLRPIEKMEKGGQPKDKPSLYELQRRLDFQADQLPWYEAYQAVEKLEEAMKKAPLMIRTKKYVSQAITAMQEVEVSLAEDYERALEDLQSEYRDLTNSDLKEMGLDKPAPKRMEKGGKLSGAIEPPKEVLSGKPFIAAIQYENGKVGMKFSKTFRGAEGMAKKMAKQGNVKGYTVKEYKPSSGATFMDYGFRIKGS